MSWNSTLGLVAMISLAMPIFLMIVLRLFAYRTFPALILNLSFTLFYNLSLKYINLSNQVVDNLNIWNNMLDAPLMLLFLTYFSATPAFTKRMRYTVLLFILFELAVIALVGYNLHALTIIVGPGLAIVFGFCLHFFIRQTKITIMHRKATGKAIIAASLLFGYGCYLLIYVMYYVLKTPFVADAFLVYFLSVTISSLMMSTGIIFERRRVQKLYELKQTRKELSIVYNEPAKSTPLKTAMLDFDKEQWN